MEMLGGNSARWAISFDLEIEAGQIFVHIYHPFLVIIKILYSHLESFFRIIRKEWEKNHQRVDFPSESQRNSL